MNTRPELAAPELLLLPMQKAEEAAMWEKRVQQLLARYGKVDIEEYKRVEDQLKQLQASLKDTVPRKDLAQV